MDLAAGTRIGPYEVVAPIGAGGMGEVYRARDTRLNRTVAVKILSRQFSSEPERVARFEREARTLASLNHPNIAQIYGTERSEDVHALAMEFVDGEDLAQTLVRGPLPPDEAISMARQIADALAAAHDLGIVHRDLKPANVKVRADGTVKVLDFGLARAINPPSDIANTEGATLTSPAMTQMGVILGTAAYMSPEQAKGKPVDRGSDVWAFGAVLYEMLTGRPAFAGETVTDVLASIVAREPDWSALPATTPAAVRRLLQRCLERDRRRRLADAGEARFQLDEAFAGESVAKPTRRAAALGRLIPWSTAALLAIAVFVLAMRIARQPATESARYTLEVPPKARLSSSSRPAITTSPDGRTIVFVATVDGVDRLFERRTDTFDAREIPGTENASSPAISPDGRTVAFAVGTRLVKVAVAGGPVTTLASIVESRGISWDENDAIVYSPAAVGGIWRVSATGGPPVQITHPAAAERTHRYPQQLPGGAVIFTVDSDATPDSYEDASIVAQMPDGSRHAVVSQAAMARYVPTGHLLFARNGTLFASRFDLERAETIGTPVEIVTEVAGDLTTGAHHFAAGRLGSLVYVSGRNAAGSTAPFWMSRSGQIESLELPPGGYNDLRLSSDGQQVAMAVIAGASTDIWIYHLQRRTFVKVTFGGMNVTPIWSRDGATLYYTQIDPAQSRSTIMRRPSDGSRQPEAVATLPGRAYLNGLTAGDRDFVVNVYGGQQRVPSGPNNSMIGLLPIGPDARLIPLVGETDSRSASVSPDGRWLAFVDRDPNREVLVRPTAGGGRWQVSPAGGEEPKWSRDGRHLYYRNSNELMEVTIDPRATVWESSVPVQIAKGLYDLRNESGLSYDVDVKDQRFLILRLADEAAGALSLRLITNFTNESK